MVNLVFSPPSNVTTFVQHLSYIDGLTDIGYGGMLGIVFMVIIFFILNLIMKSFRTETTFAPAAMITAVCGILIRVFFPLSDNIIYISIILFVIGLLYAKKDASNQEI